MTRSCATRIPTTLTSTPRPAPPRSCRWSWRTTRRSRRRPRCSSDSSRRWPLTCGRGQVRGEREGERERERERERESQHHGHAPPQPHHPHRPHRPTPPDYMDIGAAYRALVGVPGGLLGPHGDAIVAANAAVHNMTLLEGVGSDPDTIGYNTGESMNRSQTVCVFLLAHGHEHTPPPLTPPPLPPFPP